MLQQPYHASVDKCPGGHLWLQFSCPFVLKQIEDSTKSKGPKIQGRHQGPTAPGDRSSPMSAGPAHPTQLVFGVPTHYQLLIRQQPTTNDYSRLQTFVQRLSLDRHCIFATQLQKHRKWKSYNKERLSHLHPIQRQTERGHQVFEAAETRRVPCFTTSRRYRRH